MDLIQYIDEYGEYTFGEKEFNYIDNLIFSQLCYTDFEGIVSLDNEISLENAAKHFYSLYNADDIEKLIGISRKSAELLKHCSMKARYKNIKLCHYINNVNSQIDKQFSAIHFLLDNGDDVIAYRGTDITVTGVKESAMLSYMFPIPAQIEALYYFQETAMRHQGDIIVCGHSKGGNLAVFAAVNCSNSLKKRLKTVYENDAPGFPKHFFERYDYQQIKDKIVFITPQGSLIGRMLYHDVKPKIVHSTNSGLKQHQVSSWEINNDYELVQEDKYDYFSDFAGDYINNLIDYINDDELDIFFDVLEYVAEHMGIEDFYDTKELDIKKALYFVDSITTIDESQKIRFKQILKKASTDFAKFYFQSKKDEYMQVLEHFKSIGKAVKKPEQPEQ